MAVSLDSSPNSKVSANDPIIWKLHFTAMGTGTQIKRLIYWIDDGAGNKLSAEKNYVWIPTSTTDTISINAQEITEGYTKTAFPIAGTGITVDTNAAKTIRLVYKESTFDTATCIDTLGSEAYSSAVTVFNSALDINTSTIFDWSGGVTGCLMNSFVGTMKLSKYTQPFFWYAGTGAAKITYYNSAGAAIGSTINHTFTGALTVKYCCLDFKVHGITETPFKCKLEIDNGLGFVSYWFNYHSCSCKEFFSSLKFLDPKGGRSDVVINCDTDIYQIQRTGSTARQYNSTSNLYVDKSFLVKSKKELTLKIYADISNDYAKFVMLLLNSPSHHILSTSNSGTQTWYKFILNNQSAKIVNNLVEVTGYLVDELNSQKID